MNAILNTDGGDICFFCDLRSLIFTLVACFLKLKLLKICSGFDVMNEAARLQLRLAAVMQRKLRMLLVKALSAWNEFNFELDQIRLPLDVASGMLRRSKVDGAVSWNSVQAGEQWR